MRDRRDGEKQGLPVDKLHLEIRDSFVRPRVHVGSARHRAKGAGERLLGVDTRTVDDRRHLARPSTFHASNARAQITQSQPLSDGQG